MRKGLSLLLITVSLLTFSQIDEIGVDEDFSLKRIKISTEKKDVHLFLDGKYLGSNAAKIELNSQQRNFLFAKFPDGSTYEEFLKLNILSGELRIKGKIKNSVKRQNQSFFDSTAIRIFYDIREDDLIGLNGNRSIRWSSPSNTIFLDNKSTVEKTLASYFTLNGIPSIAGNIDTNQVKHKIEIHVTGITLNVQNTFGYLDTDVAFIVKNTKDEIVYEKNVFAAHADVTKSYRFFKSYDSTIIKNTNLIINDTNFIRSIKRKTERDHKKIEKIIVDIAPVTIKDTALKKQTERTIVAFDPRFIDATARLKTDKGLFVGVVVAEAGYLLTTSNKIKKNGAIYVKVHGKRTMKGKVLRVGSKTGVALVQILSNENFPTLEVSKSIPKPKDSVATIFPSKTWLLKKGNYKNEVAVFNNYYHTAKITTGKNTDGTPLLNSEGQIIGIYNDKVATNKAQKISYFIPINDALEDLNLKLQ